MAANCRPAFSRHAVHSGGVRVVVLHAGSGALAGRLLVILFQHSFFGREDPGLTDRLMGELPGILNWAIEGYERLQARGHFVHAARIASTT